MRARDRVNTYLMKRHGKLAWPIRWPLANASAWVFGREDRALFEHVDGFCLFLGYSRSGHSVVAALLDAHPNLVIAHEFEILRYVDYGTPRTNLYYLLWENARIRGHSWERGGGYRYEVPGMWQGRCEEIRVIGEKHGEYTAHYLARSPGTLARLRRRVGVPLRFIHVIRNPFDNIAAMTVRSAKTRAGAAPLDHFIDHYFDTCDRVQTVRARLAPDEILDVDHHEFVASPTAGLSSLCHFLGVDAPADYLEACREAVFESPRRTRDAVEWSAAQRDRVLRSMQRFDYLQGYDLDGP